MSCGNCGAPSITVHAVLRCTSERRYTCPCCKVEICLTCREEVGEPSDEPICDCCWIEKHPDDDEASEGFRLTVIDAFRRYQDMKD